MIQYIRNNVSSLTKNRNLQYFCSFPPYYKSLFPLIMWCEGRRHFSVESKLMSFSNNSHHSATFISFANFHQSYNTCILFPLQLKVNLASKHYI